MGTCNNVHPLSLSNVPEEFRTAYLYMCSVLHDPGNFAYVPTAIRGGALSAEEFVGFIVVNLIFDGNIEIFNRNAKIN